MPHASKQATIIVGTASPLVSSMGLSGAGDVCNVSTVQKARTRQGDKNFVIYHMIWGAVTFYNAIMDIL